MTLSSSFFVFGTFHLQGRKCGSVFLFKTKKCQNSILKTLPKWAKQIMDEWDSRHFVFAKPS